MASLKEIIQRFVGNPLDKLSRVFPLTSNGRNKTVPVTLLLGYIFTGTLLFSAFSFVPFVNGTLMTLTCVALLFSLLLLYVHGKNLFKKQSIDDSGIQDSSEAVDLKEKRKKNIAFALTCLGSFLLLTLLLGKILQHTPLPSVVSTTIRACALLGIGGWVMTVLIKEVIKGSSSCKDFLKKITNHRQIKLKIDIALLVLTAGFLVTQGFSLNNIPTVTER